MSTTCDRIACSHPATLRIAGRPWCDACARALAESVRRSVGRSVIDLSKQATLARA